MESEFKDPFFVAAKKVKDRVTPTTLFVGADPGLGQGGAWPSRVLARTLPARREPRPPLSSANRRRRRSGALDDTAPPSCASGMNRAGSDITQGRRGVFWASVAVIAMLCLVPSARADEADAPGEPTYPTSGRAPQFQFSGVLPSVELVGLDLTQGGVRIDSSLPVLEAGVPLDLSLYLRPVSARVETRKIRVNLRPPGVGPAPGYLEFFDFGLDDWEFRNLYKKTYRMELPRRRFVGRGILSFSEVDPKEEDWQQAAVLHVMPVDVPARVWPSAVDDARLRTVFDGRVKRLRAAFTLAPGTQVSLSVEAGEQPITGIGLLSYVSWHELLAVGDALCRVTLRFADHSERSAPPIIFGETTYKAVVSSNGGASDLAGVKRAWSDPISSEDGEAKQRCMYLGVLPLAKDAPYPSEMVFEYAGETGMLDVFEVVLIEGP